MRFKTIHIVGFGYLLDEKGSFLYQEGEMTRIRTKDWSFFGKTQIVNSYYHHWFDVSQLGLENHFNTNIILRLEDDEVVKIKLNKNKKVNHVIQVLNRIKEDFKDIYKPFECEDLFYLFPVFFQTRLPEEIQKMIYNYCPNVGWFKMSIFLKL